MEAADVVRALEAAVLARGCAPKYIRSDNEPEFVARAVREWIAVKRRNRVQAATFDKQDDSTGCLQSVGGNMLIASGDRIFMMEDA